jgi:hypothetical protein
MANEPRLIGTHKDCGGAVYYHRHTTYAYRRCKKCGQDGTKGQPSPIVE